MKKIIMLCSLFALVFFQTTHVAAAISFDLITFDDLPNLGNTVANTPPVPNGYDGLNWDNFDYMDANVNFGSGTPNGYTRGLISAPYEAFDDGGNPASFSSTTHFNFYSAYITPAWNSVMNVQVQGFLNSVLKYDVTYVLSNTAAGHVTPNFLDINSVTFTPSGGTSPSGSHFALDNVFIPEPSQWPLVLLVPIAVFLFNKKIFRNHRFHN